MQDLTRAIRCAKGDYVKFIAEQGKMVVGKILRKVEDTLTYTITCADNKSRVAARSELYKATPKEFEEARNMAFIEEVPAPEPITLTEEEVAPRVRLTPRHEKYTKHTGTTTTSGRTCYDINDPVADALRGLMIDDVYNIVRCHLKKILGKDAPTFEELVARYQHLNPGMQRMNLGNMLRGAMRKHGVKELDPNVGIDCM